MRIEIDGQVHTVDFRHCIYPIKWSAEQRGYTDCWVDERPGSGDAPTPAGGSAYCMLSDVFRKATGRKVALARALAKYPRDFRMKFWAAYLKQARV